MSQLAKAPLSTLALRCFIQMAPAAPSSASVPILQQQPGRGGGTGYMQATRGHMPVRGQVPGDSLAAQVPSTSCLLQPTPGPEPDAIQSINCWLLHSFRASGVSSP